MIKGYKKVPAKKTVESLTAFKSSCQETHTNNMALISNEIEKIRIKERIKSGKPASKRK